MFQNIRYIAISLLMLNVLAFNISLPAQTSIAPLRLEFETKPNTESYTLLPFMENGFAILMQTNNYEEGNKRQWEFTMYDTLFRQSWNRNLLIPRTFSLKAYSSNAQTLAGFLYDEKASQNDNFFLFVTRTDSSGLFTIQGALAYKCDIVNVFQSNSWFYVGMNTRNEARVFRIHCTNGEIQELTLNPEGGGFLHDISTEADLQGVIAVTGSRNNRNRNALFLHRFDVYGKESGFVAIPPSDNKKTLISAQYVSLAGARWMITGSYAEGSSRKSSSGSTYDEIKAAGFYQIISKDNNQSETNFVSFSDFGDQEDYIRGPVAESLHRKVKRQQRKGKPVQLEYNLITHKVKKIEGNYLLCAEAFSPDYRTVTTISYDYYGRPVPRSYTVFDGYRYSHAVVATFNETGRMIWNSGIEMVNIRSFELDPKVTIYGDDNGMVMAYNHEGKIAWKPVGVEGMNDNISYVSLESMSPRDRITVEQKSNLEHWYKNFFLASGYQTITNNYLPSNQKRSVFYINKIAFE